MDLLDGGIEVDTVDYFSYSSSVVVDLLNGTVSFPDDITSGAQHLPSNVYTGDGKNPLTGDAASNTLNAGVATIRFRSRRSDLLVGGTVPVSAEWGIGG